MWTTPATAVTGPQAGRSTSAAADHGESDPGRIATAADLLAGRWTLGATSHFFWLDRRHGDPVHEFTVHAHRPLQIDESIDYDVAGHPVRVSGITRVNGDHLLWRGSARHRWHRRRWVILGLCPRGLISVIRSAPNRHIGPGVSVLLREGVEAPELRTAVSSSAEELGLTAEDFASLTWIR